VVNGRVHVYLRMENLPDVITRVVEGTKEDHTVSWAPISNPDVHQRIVSTCSFPMICQNTGIWVVSDIASFDEEGGTRHYSYQYQDARSDALGRGWLGFSSRQETDSATGIVTTSTFDNITRKGSAYPYTSLPKTESSIVTLDNGHVFSRLKTWSYQYISTNGASVYSVLPQQIIEEEFESPVSTAEVPQRMITTTYNKYDAFGNPQDVIRVTGDGYRNETVTVFDNHPDIWLITMPKHVLQTDTTPLGETVTRSTDYSYDTNTGSLIGETIEPKGNPSLKLLRIFFRDNLGLVTSVQETSAWPQRNTWFWYDNLEHTWLYLIRNALGQESQYVYHPSFGILVAVQDPNNTYTRWQVDGFGRVRTALPPDGADVSISYGRDSTTGTTNTVKIRKAGGQEIETIIDRLGLESSRSARGFDGRQIWVDKSYDAAGRLVQITNPYFGSEVPSGVTSLNYDALGRLRKATWPDGNFAERQYSGLITSIFDENRNLRILAEDQRHRVISVTERTDDGHNIVTWLTYGPFGVLETVTDPVGNKTTARFNTRGRRSRLMDPDSGLHTTTWSPLNELDSETNSAGTRFNMSVTC
jgi:YD repeat-containing protein